MEWISNFFPHFEMDLITYTCCDLMLVNGEPGYSPSHSCVNGFVVFCFVLFMSWSFVHPYDLSNAFMVASIVLRQSCFKSTWADCFKGTCAGLFQRSWAGLLHGYMGKAASRVLGQGCFKGYLGRVASWVRGQGCFKGVCVGLLQGYLGRVASRILGHSCFIGTWSSLLQGYLCGVASRLFG